MTLEIEERDLKIASFLVEATEPLDGPTVASALEHIRASGPWITLGPPTSTGLDPAGRRVVSVVIVDPSLLGDEFGTPPPSHIDGDHSTLLVRN